ncbi:MAG: hypothetical protein UW74_C0003G0005 [Candidatus Giovannonibacteria bacterium GW2011_GWC2_44_8]|uniref:Uncharacterized protein n=1 Tax=Candidatus Giovannonibacteria bacterium GW2011_GWC2_44_8 TaxID=1618657 RepID=A0A0G1N4L5_9BACT|nr:MAG: hypothetical protein UW74_C0003G0005 [Candidatus Giovannonibacteria bacterium GW2011_GWC2_44_8]
MARFNPNRREKSEFSEKMVDLRRVARVMAGGRWALALERGLIRLSPWKKR